MRLLPRSLFGRLMLILIVGLVLIQVISASLLMRDRNQVLRDSFGFNLMNRITSLVNLVESMPQENRQQIATAMSGPGFRIRIGDRPLPLPPNATRADHLESRLKRHLENHPQVQVSFDATAFNRWRENRHMEHRPGPGFRRGPPMHHVGFHVQVQLKDGQWLSISRALPEGLMPWPGRMLITLLLVLAAIVLISLFAVRQLTRPLNTLAGAADELGRDIDRPPLPETGSREVQKASRAFNNMQQRLKRYINDRSRMLAAVSHDLKTPITRLRLRTEMLPDEETKQKFEKDLDEMEQMVVATLDYMRGTDSSEKPVEIDLVALLEALQDDMAALGWKVSLDSAELSPYRGRPLALKRCFSNLVENAVRYGDEAHITVEESQEQVTVSIEDRGPGLDEKDLENLFKPFYRGEGSRSRETGGSGLGLGIARNIARAHGGDVTLKHGTGGGLEVVVTLPR
ncbi:MAG: ATP-binding protein [Sedimenticola sp.]